MPSLSTAISSNALFSPSYIPVAVFVGGTSGIGQAMVEVFARHTSGRAHIIIVGRNSKAAQTTLASLPKSAVEGDPEIRREFISCDAFLMKNVKAATDELLGRLPKINFLVVSQGYASFGGRDETEEGIDKAMALRYYSRWKFIYELMPLLRKARDAGEEAKVMSVLAAGEARNIDLDDLAIKKNFTGRKSMQLGAAYTDNMLEVRFFITTEPRPLYNSVDSPLYRNSPCVNLTLPSHIYFLDSCTHPPSLQSSRVPYISCWHLFSFLCFTSSPSLQSLVQSTCGLHFWTATRDSFVGDPKATILGWRITKGRRLCGKLSGIIPLKQCLSREEICRPG